MNGVLKDEWEFTEPKRGKSVTSRRNRIGEASFKTKS